MTKEEVALRVRYVIEELTDDTRDAEILVRILAGQTYEQVGEAMSLSHQRVGQRAKNAAIEITKKMGSIISIKKANAWMREKIKRGNYNGSNR